MKRSDESAFREALLWVGYYGISTLIVLVVLALLAWMDGGL